MAKTSFLPNPKVSDVGKCSETANVIIDYLAIVGCTPKVSKPEIRLYLTSLAGRTAEGAAGGLPGRERALEGHAQQCPPTPSERQSGSPSELGRDPLDAVLDKEV